MNWEPQPQGVHQRYPFERWDQIFFVVPMQAADATAGIGREKTAIFSTRYWLGYLTGFPSPLLALDKELHEQTRLALFDTLFGDEGAQSALKSFASLFLARDLPVLEGLLSGQRDGQLFFAAVERGENPYQPASFAHLHADVRSGKVDYC